MKKVSVIEMSLWVLLAVPFVYLALVWAQLPESVPTHFNAQGEADDYSSKSSLVWILLFMQLLPFILLKYIPQLDPKRKPEDFGQNYERLRLIITLFMAAIGCIIVMAAYQKIDMALILPVLLSALFAGIGNYISTAKPNYFVGIRTPWTLESEEVWRKTHRLGGRLMFWAGVACLVLSFLMPAEVRLPLILVLLVGSCLVPTVYSYFAYRQSKA
ncbi:MAG: SdpI family protein [Saprospiraceae bacterium]|nr:SdpI family protein [Saprospiraceae bacterium]